MQVTSNRTFELIGATRRPSQTTIPWPLGAYTPSIKKIYARGVRRQMGQTFADSRKKRISATTAEPPLSLVRYAGRPINTTSPVASLASQLVHFFVYPKIQPVRPRLLPTKTKENTPKESTEERGTPTSTKPCLVAPAFCGKRTLLLYNRAQTFLHPTFHPCSPS